MYTVEYYDDEDMRPCWCVVEWHGTGLWRTGHTVERCDNQAEAESLLHSYMLIHRLTMH